MLLSVELPSILQALECLLGGEASQAPAERHLTRGRLGARPRPARHGRGRALDRLGRARRHRARRAARSTSRATPARHRGPRTDAGDHVRRHDRRPRLDDVAADAVGGGRAGRRADPRHAGTSGPAAGARRAPTTLRRGLAGAQVLLRAEVGSVQMPIERMLELVPGALVDARRPRRGRRAACSPRRSRVGRGRPGAAARGSAIKLESTGEPPDALPTRTRSSAAPSSSGRARTRREQPPSEGSRSCAASSCASGPSSAARTCRSGRALELSTRRGRRARPSRRGAGRAVRQRALLRQRQPRRHGRRRVGRAGRRARLAARARRSQASSASRPRPPGR